MTEHEVLVAARNLIADPKDWAQGNYDVDGGLCIVGAIAKAAGVSHGEAHMGHPATLTIDKVIGTSGTARWNDTHSHTDVLAAFDKAIAATAPKPDLSFLADVKVEEAR